MNEYINNFDNYKISLIYDFKKTDGGLSDYIKFFTFYLLFCIENKYKLFLLINNTHLENLIKLKYPIMYFNTTMDTKIIKKNINVYTENFNEDTFYVVCAVNAYDKYTEFHNIKLSEIFNFDDKIINKSNNLLNINNSYISIHLRLGDYYLETKNNVIAIGDRRTYNIEKLYEFIENNMLETLIFFCDNKTFKLKLKQKYKNIIILDCLVGHTGLLESSYEETLDAISEFYIMSKSKKIFSFSYSGYPLIASKFFGVPFFKMY